MLSLGATGNERSLGEKKKVKPLILRDLQPDNNFAKCD